MSSTPFRTAFWSLGLACALTLLLALPNPQNVRLALRDAARPPGASAQLAETQTPRPAPVSPVDDPPSSATGIRIASANPAQPLGIDAPAPPSLSPSVAAITGPTQPAASLAPPMSLPSFAESPSVLAQTAPAPPSPGPWEATGSERNIPVPDPAGLQDRRPETSDKPQLDDPWGPLPAAPLARTARPLPPQNDPATASPPNALSIAEAPPSAEDRSIRPAPDRPDFPPLNPPIHVAAPTPAQELIEFTPAESDGRWNIRFRQVPLETLLTTLGQRAGWNVLIDGELADRCSGEFRDIDPGQAFAVMLKLHRCTVNRRGQSLLVSQKVDARYR